MAIDMDEPLDPAALAADLVAVESTSGAEGEVVALLDDLLALRGWQVQRIPVTPGRDDLLVTTGQAPDVTFSTHLDTVPPFIPPRFSWCAASSGLAGFLLLAP